MENPIVRKNLMEVEGYSPYCGAVQCRRGWPRTSFNGHQFECSCGWVSKFPTAFIAEFKSKWEKYK